MKKDTPITDEQREELDRRLDAYHANPKAGRSWEAVKASIRKQKEQSQ